MADAIAEPPKVDAAIDPSQAMPAPAPVDPGSDPMADLDKLVGIAPVEPPGDAPVPTPEKAAPPAREIKPAKKEEPKAEPVKVETKAEPKAPDPADEFKGKDPKELRKALANYKARQADLERKVTEFESRVKSEPDVKALTERLKVEEEQRKKIEDELRFANYERHPEFKQKYEEPLKKELERAYKRVSDLEVEGEDGSIRKGDPNDFYAILNAADGQAWKKAKELFGDAAPTVMMWREKVSELASTRSEALERYRTEAGEKTKVTEAERIKSEETLRGVWDSTNKEIAERMKSVLGNGDGDTEKDKVLDEGFKLADLSFGKNDLTPEQVAKVDAVNRNRSAAFGPLVHMNKKLKERVGELEKAIAEYEKSGPKEESHKAGEAKEKTPEDELDALAAM